MYYDLIGTEVIEITPEEWFSNKKEPSRQLFRTVLPNGVLISTVFVSVASSIFGGDPLVFETMVFGGEYDCFRRKYTSYKEAECGHQETIEMLFEV